MNYPLPRQREFFSYRQSDGVWGSAHAAGPSWLEYNDIYKEQCAYIAKRQWIWKIIPFLESVYISDKLSFNAATKPGDIDVFMITNVGRLWHVKCVVTVLFAVLKLVKIFNKGSYHFTCNFMVARDECDLQSVKLVPYDPYLIYWIAHLVPIYQQFDQHEINIWKENKRIQYYLPDHPLQQTVFIDCEKVQGITWLRKKTETVLQGLFGDALEWLMRVIGVPLLLRRRNKLGPKGECVIIASKMIKFHYDKRENYALKRKIAMK